MESANKRVKDYFKVIKNLEISVYNDIFKLIKRHGKKIVNIVLERNSTSPSGKNSLKYISLPFLFTLSHQNHGNVPIESEIHIQSFDGLCLNTYMMPSEYNAKKYEEYCSICLLRGNTVIGFLNDYQVSTESLLSLLNSLYYIVNNKEKEITRWLPLNA